jgi:hypothetical protein
LRRLLLALAVPANLLAQPLVQRVTSGIVFCLSHRGVFGSASLVIGVDLLRVLRPLLRAGLGMAGPAPGAQATALLPMDGKLGLVLPLPTVSAGLHGRGSPNFSFGFSFVYLAESWMGVLVALGVRGDPPPGPAYAASSVAMPNFHPSPFYVRSG